jgi:hypothetical protein
LPNNKNHLLPKRSEFAPAIRKPMAFAVVYAGIYHALDVGSPNWTASRDIIAEVVGTGQKERPNVEDKTKMTNHVFGVIVVAS